MRRAQTFPIALLLVMLAAVVTAAHLKDWKKMQFEPTGMTPAVETMEQFRAVFTDALTCAGCHQSHYDTWNQSFHAKSIANPSFQFLYLRYLEYLQTAEPKQILGREPGAEELRQCLFCHAPQVQFASDALVQEISDAIVAGNWEHIRTVQISCVVCHSMTPDGKWSADPFHVDGVLYGPIQDPAPAAASRHRSEYSELHTKSEFCATCHSQKPFNVFCSLVYDQWVTTESAARGEQCQDCHMPSTENVRVAIGGRDDRTLHDHSFRGGRDKNAWPDAIDLALAAERSGGDVLVAVTMKNKIPHNIPDG
jgi:hypothetical protein